MRGALLLHGGSVNNSQILALPVIQVRNLRTPSVSECWLHLRRLKFQLYIRHHIIHLAIRTQWNGFTVERWSCGVCAPAKFFTQLVIETTQIVGIGRILRYLFFWYSWQMTVTEWTTEWFDWQKVGCFNVSPNWIILDSKTGLNF